MRTFIFIIICFFLFACGPPKSTHIQLGKEVKAPSGWTDYCNRNPTDPMCVPNKGSK